DFLKASGAYSTNFSLEASEDLKYWRPVLNVQAGSVNPSFYCRDIPLGPNRKRFYRAMAPGVSASEQKRLWTEMGIHFYSFRFRRICFCRPIFLSAIVFVRNAKVEFVKDAFDGQEPIPVAKIDLSAFKSIEELFQILLEAEQKPADLIVADYDPDTRYPRR